MYDAIIVGARCAGSPVAMLLARNGYRALVVDRSTFPSDIMSTHFIGPVGINHLDRWGLLPAVAATNCPPIYSITMRLGELAMQPPKDPNGPDALYCPRRTVLDKLLVDAAADAGAEVREGVTLQDLTWDGDRVTGVRIRDQASGAESTEQARVVVGADGIHSTVARAVQAPSYNEHAAKTCGYYAYFSGMQLDGTEICLGDKTGLLAFPTNDDLTCVAVMRPIETFADYKKDIDATFRTWGATASPVVAEKLKTAKREERFVGTAETQNYYRKPYGPGWALVGDAGYHRDPVTGLGISDAFRDAQLLANALDDGFAGRAPLDDALAGYEQARNEQSADDYERTLFLASLPSPAEVITRMQQQAPAATA